MAKAAKSGKAEKKPDPFERGPSSSYYTDWHAHRTLLLVPAQGIIAKMPESFKEFPPRAKAASFTVSDAMKRIETARPNQN